MPSGLLGSDSPSVLSFPSSVFTDVVVVVFVVLVFVLPRTHLTPRWPRSSVFDYLRLSLFSSLPPPSSSFPPLPPPSPLSPLTSLVRNFFSFWYFCPVVLLPVFRPLASLPFQFHDAFPPSQFTVLRRFGHHPSFLPAGLGLFFPLSRAINKPVVHIVSFRAYLKHALRLRTR